MKFKMIALFLALSLSAWAQTATTPNPTTPQDTPKAGCSDCCKHMAGDKDTKDTKDAKGCCHDMKAMGNGKMSCCEGKDGKACMGKDGMSCMKGEKADASCGKGKCCDMKGGKGCCSHGDGDKTAMACCSGTQCGMDHAHGAMN
jgi:hypothetical protein